MEVPHLLSTRRRIQNEAYPVWLSANTFTAMVHHFDDRFLHCFATPAKTCNAKPRINICLRGEANWRNLLVWCRRVWEGQSIVYAKHGAKGRLRPIVSKAHRIVERHSQASWDDCRQALDAMASCMAMDWSMRQRFANAPVPVKE